MWSRDWDRIPLDSFGENASLFLIGDRSSRRSSPAAGVIGRDLDRSARRAEGGGERRQLSRRCRSSCRSPHRHTGDRSSADFETGVRQPHFVLRCQSHYLGLRRLGFRNLESAASKVMETGAFARSGIHRSGPCAPVAAERGMKRWNFDPSKTNSLVPPAAPALWGLNERVIRNLDQLLPKSTFCISSAAASLVGGETSTKKELRCPLNF